MNACSAFLDIIDIGTNKLIYINRPNLTVAGILSRGVLNTSV